MTATLEAIGERRGKPTPAVVTSDGATWSWPELFDHFGPAIHSFARSRGASSPDDIVQDVFASAVERFPRFSGDSSGLRSFLFTLAYRRVADDHRVRYRRRELLVADHAPTIEVSVDLEDSFIEGEVANEALKALDILGDRERRVIEMRIIEEASPAQVADALGLSNGNVRVIQARALMKIRKYLEGRSGALPSFGLVLAFLKSLRAELPGRGGLAEWIEMLQAESARDTAKAAVGGAGPVIAAGTTSTSFGAIAGSVLKIGLVVALATAPTSAVGPGVDTRKALTAPGADESLAAATELADKEPGSSATPSHVIDEWTIGVAPYRPTIVDPAVPPSARTTDHADDPLAVSEPQATESGPDGVASPAVGVVEPVVGGIVEPVVEEVVETIDTVANGVVNTVETVVDDVVQPVVETVTEVVDVTVGTVEDTVNDTVGDVVQVVDDTSESVDDTVGSVTDPVDSVVGGLGGLLGR